MLEAGARRAHVHWLPTPLVTTNERAHGARPPFSPPTGSGVCGSVQGRWRPWRSPSRFVSGAVCA